MLARDRLGHQAAVPGRDARPAAVRLHPARAAGRRRRRHLDRPGRAAPLHDLPLGGAGAAHDPRRRPQAAAGHRAHRSSPTARSSEHVYWRPEHVRRARARRHDRRATGRDAAAGGAADGGARGGWSPTCRSACCSPAGWTPAARGAARRAGPARADHVQHRLRGGGRRERRRVRVLRPHRRALRHRPPPDPDRPGPVAARRGRTRSRRWPSRWSATTASPSTCSPRRSPSTSRSCSPGRARTRSSPATAGTRRWPASRASAAVEAYAGVFFDRPHAELAADPRAGVAARPRREPGVRRRALRPRPAPTTTLDAALRLDSHGHAGRRPGQAGRQHDHGLGPGGARAVPRSRAGRAGRGLPARAEAGARRQGRAEGGRPRGGAGRGHRPAQGLLPGSGDPAPGGTVPGPGAGRADRPGGQGPRAVPRGTTWTRCWPTRTPSAPPWARTSCGSSRCWRCGCRTRGSSNQGGTG